MGKCTLHFLLQLIMVKKSRVWVRWRFGSHQFSTAASRLGPRRKFEKKGCHFIPQEGRKVAGSPISLTYCVAKTMDSMIHNRQYYLAETHGWLHQSIL